jgi:hypothetical protein
MSGERGRVLVSGGTGLIGGHVVRDLAAAGYEVVVLTRDPERAKLPPGVRAAGWDAESDEGWSEVADGAAGIVHLAGESIAGGRWTAAKKRRIRDSRLRSGRAVVAAIEAAERKPAWLLQASGIGYYGPRGVERVTEETGPGEGFLAELAVDWEASTEPVERLGVRRAILRTGLVLAREGGLLPRMLKPFKLGIGGPMGSGEQYMPWIHVADEVAAIRFLAGHADARGPFNLCAPEPVTNAELAGTLAGLLGRPAALRAPAFVLRIALGELASEVLTGQRAVPERLEALGFEFRFPALEPALEDLLD